MTELDLPRCDGWRKSTFSKHSDCVEVAFAGQGVLVRDSKDVAGPVLRCSRVGWVAFIAGIRNGEFDDG